MAIQALSYSYPVAARSASVGGTGGTGGKRSPSALIKARLKHQKSGKHEERAFPYPMCPAEEFASQLDLEMAVAGLEQLFHRSGPNPPDAGGAASRRPFHVVYQGVRGSYCHEAAIVSFPSPAAVKAFPCGAHMEYAFSALEDGSANVAVVPAENSLDGPITRNLDLLLRHPDVRISGEFVVPVNHCLLTVPGAGIPDLRRVVSHPQALRHCERRLRSFDLEIEEVADAAEAAREVAEDGIFDTAVIGSRIAAEEFGLQVLERDFQDGGGNYNRFLQLVLDVVTTDGDNAGSGSRKTTVAFSLEKGVSGLCRALWAFESQGVRVTRIDNRPNREKPVRMVDRIGVGEVVQMDYVFVLEAEGSESDRRVATAIGLLAEIAGFVRVLGSYPCRCLPRVDV